MNLPFVFMGGMPGMPMGMGQQQQQQQVGNEADCPIRVQRAMEYVQALNQATMKRAAVTDTTVHEIDGRELTAEERDCRDSALKVIREYFDGKLKMDVWEDFRHKFQQSKIQLNNAVQTAASSIALQGGEVLNCPRCERPGDTSCKMCGGTMKCVVTPLALAATQVPLLEEAAVEPVAAEEEPPIGGA